MIASHFQITTDCGARALSRMLLVMMMIFLTLGFPFDWIEITNCRADNSKVGFNDGVVTTSPFQRSDVQPGSLFMVVLKHLKTRKISHDQEFHTIPHLWCTYCTHQLQPLAGLSEQL